MRSDLSQEPPAGFADYEGSRCSSEIRINVRLRGRWESPCLSFVLPSICQCQSVNYRFIYLVSPVRVTNVPLLQHADRNKDFFLVGLT